MNPFLALYRHEFSLSDIETRFLAGA